jgi:hypothetical protein
MGSGAGRCRRRDEHLIRPSCLVGALAAAAVALGSGPGRADPPAQTDDPDEEFLEFLGTVDSTSDANASPDDQSWIDYLSQTDIDRAALGRAAQGQAAKQANDPGQSATKAPSGVQSPDSKPKVKSDDQ